MVPVHSLNDLQVAVLRWIADGCPPRGWPNQSQKTSARGLEALGLVCVGRKNKVWTATITELGPHVLDHDSPPLPSQ